MLDVTTKNFYSHTTNHLGILSIIIVHAIMATFIGLPSRLSTRFYLDDPSSNFKIMMIVIGILMGILIFFVLKKKNEGFQTKVYLKQYPDSEKVIEKDEIEMIMTRAQIRAALVMVGVIVLPVWSVHMYRQFWNYHNFGSYFWATSSFIATSATASLWKNVRFVSKLHTEMYGNDE